jgi:hypothetical protein
MMHNGYFDPDDPYIHQKIAQIDQKLVPLQTYRSQLEQRLVDAEASDISPAEKNAVKTAITAQIKDFDENHWKPAVANRNTILNQIGARLKEQFSLQKSIALQKQAEINKQNDQARAMDNQRVAAQQKKEAILPAGHQQLNANDGLEPDGSPMVDKANNQPVLPYGEQIRKPFSEKDATTGNYTNPIVRSAQSGNPYLSAGYDGKDPATFDPTKIPDFKPTDLKTGTMISRDMILYNGGDISFRDAQDLTSGVMSGAYTVQRHTHTPIHSMVLGDLPNDDGVPRTDVYISRGTGDPTPMKVTMSTANADRLVDLAHKVDHISKYNYDMANARKMPDDKVYSSGPDTPIAPEQPPTYPDSMPQRPHQPRSASNATEQSPPVTALPPRELTPGSREWEEYLRTHPPQGPPHLQFNPKTAIPSNKPWDQPINIK